MGLALGEGFGSGLNSVGLGMTYHRGLGGCGVRQRRHFHFDFGFT